MLPPNQVRKPSIAASDLEAETHRANSDKGTKASILMVIRAASRLAGRPAARDVGSLTLALYVSAAIGFVVSVFAARTLGPVEYGSAAVAMAYPSLLRSLLGVKSGMVTTRYLARFRATAQGKEVQAICAMGYRVDLGVAVGAFLLVSATAPAVASDFLRAPELAPLMVAYALTFPFVSLQGTSRPIFAVWGRIQWYAGLLVFEKVLTLLLVVGILSRVAGAAGLVLALMISPALMGILGALIAQLLLNRDRVAPWWRAAWLAPRQLRRELFPQYGWSYLSMTMGGLMAQAPLLILGRTAGPDDAAYFRLASSFAQVAGYTEQALRRVVSPRLSLQWATTGWDRLDRTLWRWLLQAGAPAAILVSGIALALPIFVPLALGQAYSAMVGSAQVMLLGPIFAALLFFTEPLYVATGKVAFLTKLYSSYAFVFVLAAAFVIRTWGLHGLAVLVGGGSVLYTLTTAGLMVRLVGRRV